MYEDALNKELLHLKGFSPQMKFREKYILDINLPGNAVMFLLIVLILLYLSLYTQREFILTWNEGLMIESADSFTDVEALCDFSLHK